MRLVRVDQLAPGGPSLELHRRLTVVRGATQEMRGTLTAVMRGLAGSGTPSAEGQIEVSGVILALDPPTLERLTLTPGADPIVKLDAVEPIAPRSEPESASVVLMVPQASANPFGVATAADVDPLRAELHSLAERRAALGERLEAARAGLDSFSTAALEVCIGQIDALESKRSELRAGWQSSLAAAEDERAARDEAVTRLRAAVGRIEALDCDAIRDGSDALRRVVEQPPEPDPEAIRLADDLDAEMGRVRELEARRAQLQIRESEALQRLEDARREAAAAEQALRVRGVDPEVVERLEKVRDAIFEADDRHGRIGAGRQKRRLVELRSEEAILLDRLGFDTYSSYVMGIPTARSELARSERVATSERHVELISEEIRVLRDQAPDADDIDGAGRRLAALLDRANGHLGSPPPSPPAGAGSSDLADVVYSVVGRLRQRRIGAPESSPEIASRTGELTHLLERSVGGWPDQVIPELPALPSPPFEAVPGDLTSTALLALADDWLAWHQQLATWSERAVARLGELTAGAEGAGGSADDPMIARWAEVEAELDSALDRLADAQERVRLHEEATAEVAALRSEELELRETERDLLRRIAQAEAPSVDQPQPVPPPRTAALEPGDRPAPPPTVDELDWYVSARLADLRSLSFVGSAPVLVEGIPAEPARRSAVLHRLDRMSEVIQVVVLSDDDDTARWAEDLGSRGRVVQI